MSLPHLPIGLSEFKDIREGNFVYVDKTQHIHSLLHMGKRPYFLSRPRRFGKSLLISTLQALFEGKRELFADLWIEQEGRWDWSQKHPVIRLDMSLVNAQTPERLEEGLCRAVTRVAQAHGISLPQSAVPSDLLTDLIIELAQQRQVVVLIDEYDKPLVDHLGGRTRQQYEQGLDIADANRQVLKDFYTVLKGQSGDLRLVFVTGVSKFAKVSVFSGLNNLTDLTLVPQCGDLLGYTQQELESCFAPHLQCMATQRQQSVSQLLDAIRRWYNGFRFCSRDVRVYNPFSTLLLLEQQEFRAHWFSTATPTFLVKLIQRNAQLQPDQFAGAAVSQSAFESYELKNLSDQLLPLMVQTGYLTLTDYDPSKRCYTLDYPNQEVREGFLENLMESYGHLSRGTAITDLDRLTDALAQNDLQHFFVTLRTILADIPYALHITLERYYQTVFYLIHQLLGYRVHTEVQTNTGRIDAVIDLDTHTYVFEFKLEPGNPTPQSQLVEDSDDFVRLKSPIHQDQLATQLTESHNKLAQAALQQIKDKQYHIKYLGKGKPVTLVGAVFTVNDLQGRPVRQATAWTHEVIAAKTVS